MYGSSRASRVIARIVGIWLLMAVVLLLRLHMVDLALLTPLDDSWTVRNHRAPAASRAAAASARFDGRP